MKKIVIDGYFLTEKITGVQRYGLEMLRELDRQWDGKDGEIVLAVPRGTVCPVELKQIPVAEVGKRHGIAWEQIDLARYLRKEKAAVVCMENFLPVFYRKGIIMIHDISLAVNRKQFSGSLRGKVSVRWRCFHYWLHCRSRWMRIGTVSAFSKDELIRVYGADPAKITVINSAWQHIREIEADEDVFAPGAFAGKRDVVPEDYYFSLSSLAWNKNFGWIVEAARKHPEETFVIAGGGNLAAFLKEHQAEGLENLILTGYISDEQAKALMARCKAFLFPTLYEGFGLPPMEAVACGAGAIVISDLPVMHEV